MPFAASLSEHPLTAQAVAEVTGDVLERLGEPADVALLFATEAHAGALEDAAGVVRAVLSPRVLAGCAAGALLGPSREVEDAPAVGLWAGRTSSVAPVRLEVEPAGAGEALISGWPQDLAFPPELLVLIADPFSFPAGPFFEYLHMRGLKVPVVGGMASGARGPGGNRLLLDDRVVTDGAVGVFLGPGLAVDPIVSQGCRPIGPPLAVTRSEKNVIYEIAGAPALERLRSLLSSLAPEDVPSLRAKALHIGLLVDTPKGDVGPGDFVVRRVLGGNERLGAVIVDEPVELGTVVQFQVRDGRSAGDELRMLLAGHSAEPADAALMFPATDRGRQLFGEPDHDAEAITDIFGPIPTAGFFAAGEFGPVGGRNFLHTLSTSIALLRDRT